MKYLKYLNLLWQNMKWQKISICKGFFLPFDMDVLLLGWQCEWQGTSRFFHLLNNHRTVLNQTKSRLFCDWLKDDKILKILRLVEGLGYSTKMILVNWLSEKKCLKDCMMFFGFPWPYLFTYSYYLLWHHCL